MFTQRGNRMSHMARHHPGVPINNANSPNRSDNTYDTGASDSVMPVWLDACSLEEGNNLALTQDDIDEMEDSTSSIVGSGGSGDQDEEMIEYDDDTSSTTTTTSSRLLIAE